MTGERIVVVGDTGLLGQAAISHWTQRGADVLGLSRQTTPGTMAPRSESYRHLGADVLGDSRWLDDVRAFRPSLVVNAVAIVNLAACEKDPARAQAVHVRLAGTLAALAKSEKAKFVQVSTDQVFDGNLRSPYRETDATHPLNVYGTTKYQGEEAALAADPETLVARTNIVGFRGKTAEPTFAEWLFGQIEKKQDLTLFTDYVTSSMHVRDFCEGVDAALAAGMKGVVHIASSEPSSKSEFAEAVADAMGWTLEKAQRARMADKPLQPPRPLYLGLSVEKFQTATGRRLPGLRATAERLANDFRRIKSEERHDQTCSR